MLTLLWMQDLQKRFGERVRKLRIKKHLSQDEFADISGLHRAYIGTVERGETNITLRNMFILAKALDVKMSELIRGVDS
jgi:transcriptional regulator with XRE-family HTH domain